MSVGLRGENLIFIISQPRAGSTLLQKILSNHPQIHSTPEPWLMLHPLYALRSTGYEAEYNASWAKSARKSFFETLPEGEKTYFNGVRHMYSYLYQNALLDSQCRYFLDKTPRYYHIIPELYQTFPEAKFVFLLRNPMAVLCSIIDTWIKGDWGKLKNFRNDLLDAPKLLLRGIKDLENKCSVLTYEELITEPEQRIEQLCNYLNIDFLPQLIHDGFRNSPQKGFGYREQRDIHQSGKPNLSNINRWIHTLEEPQNWRVVNDYLVWLHKDTVEKMGYSYSELSNILGTHRPPNTKLWVTASLKWILENPLQKKLRKLLLKLS